ncbi:uncharacterized protein L3040_001827 [Drepanopeziza brunnea f. sp. 'multigermtubi']|uniref:DUF7053 domain-containing protein n=1 Tax=Marssonina brunnea f. sp. multigermtubi (strain MB_m1) TaxID=1072389 RepID=K1WDF9_MARBU|nr:uncharacterized protein MBM_06671 [Drepanopeziza brunnea f. sp. 'multigermtubi' MB_m1]EKD15455.1 hypothetical protein MBM_06671 [Drepanopeziza brunnea f. sp. 'multigermtubi' MB_m1]KAJ5052067.1 hypothetical protein L3040_001827 [Drepanopeziza brunnea f. sp. 'multigermtubi']
MPKRFVFTTLTPLPEGITRETVMETLRSHTEMIDLNPLVIERHPIKPPPDATAEEYHCLWYSLTDRVHYLPGGLASGQVSYTCCFHDLKDGLQTHCYAPLGLDIKGKWTLGGSLPGELIAPVEIGIGAPLHGLWLREDVDMRCNIMMGGFVKKTLKKAHSHLVGRLIMKSQLQSASAKNQALNAQSIAFAGPQASTEDEPSEYESQSIAGKSMGHTSTHSNLQGPDMFQAKRISDSYSQKSYGPGSGSGHWSMPSPRMPPTQSYGHSHNSFGSEQSDGRNSDDESLYPAGLNIRNTGGSGSEKKPSPDPAAGGQPPGERLSWQNLPPKQSPKITVSEPEYLLPATAYRPPPSQRRKAAAHKTAAYGGQNHIAELE